MKRLAAFVAIVAVLAPAALRGAGTSGGLQAAVRLYRQSHERAILAEFFSLLAIPNVALDPERMRENAALIRAMMERRGIRASVMDTAGSPVVVGELPGRRGGRTLLFYIHYDGQPVDPAQWTDSRPFGPVLRPGKLQAGSASPKPVPLPAADGVAGDDWRIYARGASDDKAPLVALLAALDALRASGVRLRNTVKFILDGEEEAGSPNLPAFLSAQRDRLRSDVLFMCDGPVYYSGDPTLVYGVRGIVSLAITVYGPDTSLHSGHFGNWAPNPALRLARLLASLKDAEGRVLVPGFYDTTVPLSEREREALRAIPPCDRELQAQFGFAAPEGKAPLMEAILSPSLNINGLQSGWVGRQSATIVPASATASIDMRLAKGNDPGDMTRKVIAHVRAQGYHVVEAEPDRETRMTYPLIARVTAPEPGYRASRTSMDLPVARSVIAALRGRSGRRVVLLPTLGGSLPNYVFEDALGVPIIGIPIANYDNNQHQQDENIRLGHLWNAIETFAAVLMME